MICKIFGLFPNTLTAEDKYSLLNRDNLLQDLQMQLSQKQKHFLNFFFSFSKFKFNFEQFQKKMTHIADVFLNFRNPKNVAR